MPTTTKAFRVVCSFYIIVSKRFNFPLISTLKGNIIYQNLLGSHNINYTYHPIRVVFSFRLSKKERLCKMFDHYWNLQISVKEFDVIKTFDYQLTSFSSCVYYLSHVTKEIVSVAIEKVML